MMLTALLVAAMVLGLGPMTRASPPAPPAFWVVPETETFTASNASVGTQFNVTVWAGATVAQTTAWQVKLAFDPTQIQAVAAFFTGPGGATSGWFSGKATFPVTPIIDNETGFVLIGETMLGTAFVGPSSGSLFDVTFQIMAAPAPGNTLTSLIDTATYAPGDTYVLDQDGNTETPFATAHCTYTFSGGGPPPPTRHDVAINSVTPASGQVNQGSSLSIQVVALNNGTVTVTETFDVNATYDGTLIGQQTVTSLAAGGTQTLTFSWNTAGVAAGTYTITATAVPVAGEIDLSNNAKTAQVEVVTAPTGHYDINGDGKVDIKDVGIAARAFGATPGTPRWDPAADVDGSGVISIKDIALIAQQFGH
jgi:hypothetical protein